MAEGAQLLRQLDLPNIIDISFSPRGTYLSTWERPGELSRLDGTPVGSFADCPLSLPFVFARFG